MKNFLIPILTTVLLAGCSGVSDATKIAVLTDVHALSTQLVEANKGDSGAFAAYQAGNMRMVKESGEILRTTVARLVEEHPDVVLVTGDLTNNGERLSHEFVASQFCLLQEHGIKVLVVPGNHDTNNPYAKSWHGDETRQAATITRQEFQEIYRTCGYGAESELHDASLSYVAEPVEGLVVLGIDSNRDEENRLKSRGDTVNTYHTAGRVKASTLHWLTNKAREARKQGKRVVAMMHHHLIEHFDGESRLLRDYVVEDWETVRNALIDAGVHVIFTGHLHITDIARSYHNGDSITDVATSSLSTYPFHYRIAELTNERMKVSTRQVNNVPSNPRLLAEGKTHVEHAVGGLMAGMLNRGLHKMDGMVKKYAGVMGLSGAESDVLAHREEILAMCQRELLPAAQTAMVALYEGNEGANPQCRQIISQAEQGVRQLVDTVFARNSNSFLHEFLSEELVPQVINVLRSMLEDRNHYHSPQEVVVDDHSAEFSY